jgi:hypothetical protein
MTGAREPGRRGRSGRAPAHHYDVAIESHFYFALTPARW